MIKFLIAFLFVCPFLSAENFTEQTLLKNLEKLFLCDISQTSVQKISGGLTNVNYKINVNSVNYFVRYSSPLNKYLDTNLETEWHNHSVAANAGLAPEIIFYAPEDSLFITSFIETSGVKVNTRDQNTQKRLCHLLRNMHQNKSMKFPIDILPFPSIESMVMNAEALNISLPQALTDTILPKIRELNLNIAPQCSELVPCHLDLHQGNLLDDGDKLWIIDWEYGAMSDPYFDLGFLASIENFSEEEMFIFLTTYLEGNTPSEEQFKYLRFMRVLCDVRSVLWHYIQSVISEIDYPFIPNGDNYLQLSLFHLNRL